MAHSESSPIIPIVVIAGLGYYAYSSGILNSLFNMFGGTSTTPTPTPPVTNPNTTPVDNTPPGAGTNTPPPPQTCPQYQSLVNNMCVTTSCPPGQILQSGVCIIPPPPTTTTPPPTATTQASCPAGTIFSPGATGSGGSCMPESIPTQLSIAAGGVGTLNYDQWNYYYQQITGQAPPAPESIVNSVWTSLGLTPGDRTTPMDVNTYYNLVTQGIAAGLAGMGLGGLGQILDFNDFYSLTREPIMHRGLFR
jgi:hypothetical protein